MSSSASRKVARAAAAGRNARAKREIPLGFYSIVALLIIIGSFVIAYSRYEKQHPVAISRGPAPQIGAKWTSAIGFDSCGTYLPNLAPQASGANGGIYLSSGGLIHIAPTSSADTGSKATLQKFISGYKGLKVSSSGFTLPDNLGAGTTKCGGIAAHEAIYVWPSLLSTTPLSYSKPARVALKNGELISIATLKSGQVPQKPPSELALVNSSQASGATSSSSTTKAG